jgi:16S rRNA pseudouridine516 synthase
MIGKRVRLDKLLANLGYGSRKEVKKLLSTGVVSFDGEPLYEPDDHLVIAPDLRERLMVEGEPLDPLPCLVLVMNKPLGVTCSRKDEGKLIYDLLPERWRQRDPPIATIGRLDKETSGLLLLTDDGALLHRVSSPKKAITKKYLATLARPLEGSEGAVFASGSLMLEGEDKPLLPAQLEVHGPLSATVSVSEGRYHQVRRMFAAVGNHVTGLHRLSIGGFSLPADLEPGEYRELKAEELAAIFET